MSREEGLNEAYVLAVSDDMYSTDILVLDEKTNELTVNLTATFAYGIQDQVKSMYGLRN